MSDNKILREFLSGFGDSIDKFGDRQCEALGFIFNALQPSFKQIIFADLQSRLIFEGNRIYYRTILSKLQDCIFDRVEKLSDSMELRVEEGQFVTNYEAKRYLMLYALRLVLDVKDVRIKYFVEGLRERILSY